MFTLSGDDFLYVAGAISLVGGLAAFFVREDGNGRILRFTRLAAQAAFLLTLISFVFLGYAFVVSDFSLLAVYQNSHTDKPLFYKVAAIWGNHEGSMLLWALVAAGYAALYSWLSPLTRLAARTLAIQGLLVTSFIAYVAFVSNPFTPVAPVPDQGMGLNPLLQDPALSFHPPMLYLGYVGFSLVFALASAGLLENRISREWAAAIRPWALAAWSCLTIGIALGSWWAYYELGWGGWWFWDPVENASLIPWLSATALIHSLIVVEKRGNLKAWTTLLALLTFCFCLIGTFLVRSGIITSVHAFALDPERGVFILFLVGIIAGGGLLLFALRAHRLEPESDFEPLSRESLLVLNNIFLFTAAITVLVGTVYPLLLDLIASTPLSVGPPYYEATFTPLMIPLIALMGIAPTIAWQRDILKRLYPHLKLPALVTVGMLLLLLMVWDAAALRFYLGITLAAWLLLTSFMHGWQMRRATPMHIAHIGLAISLFGMVASSHFSVDKVALLLPGQKMEIGGFTFSFKDMERVRSANYMAERAVFNVTGSSGYKADLYPERRFYPAANRILSEVAIASNGMRDLYLVLGEVQRDEKETVQGWNIRAHYNPLIPWIWLGCVMMALAGFYAIYEMLRHRKRLT